jgi:hypothetical protein
LKARLTKFVSMVDELNQENPNFDQLQVRFEKFKSLESEFDSVQKQIESEVDEGDACRRAGRLPRRVRKQF